MKGVQIVGLSSENHRRALSWALEHYDDYPELVKSLTPRKAKLDQEKFDLFWSEYPIKKGKEAAKKAFIKINPDDELMDTILSSLHDQIKEKKQLFLYDRFCPEWRLPTTWLNQRGWEDEIQSVSYINRLSSGPSSQCDKTRDILDQIRRDARNRPVNASASLNQLKEQFLSTTKH